MAILPRQDSAYVEAGGRPSLPFYSFLQALDRAVRASGNEAVQAEIEAIARALGSPDGSVDGIPPAAFMSGAAQAYGLLSVQSVGSLQDGAVAFQLVGDDQAPGGTYYYGTTTDGVKGFFAVADTVEAEAGELTKVVDVVGVTTFGLADLADSGAGAFKLLTRDAKGRLSGTADGTTSDVPEGSNLYHTTARARAAAVADAIADGVTDVAPSQNAVFDALATKANLSGAAFTGDVYAPVFRSATGTGGVKYVIGNDAELHDLDVANTIGVKGAQSALEGYFRFGNSTSGFGWNGSGLVFGGGAVWHAGNFDPATKANLSGAAFTGVVSPATDNTTTLGTAALRWSVVYAGTGTINTSDAREKTEPRDLTEAELACSIELARLPSIFQWLHAIEEKGDAARLHCSPTVQAVIAAMELHGLDPFRYGFVCYDEWGETPEAKDDETGEVTQEHRPAGNRYSLRPSELAHFIMRGLVHRLDRLEALESQRNVSL